MRKNPLRSVEGENSLLGRRPNGRRIQNDNVNLLGGKLPSAPKLLAAQNPLRDTPLPIALVAKGVKFARLGLPGVGATENAPTSIKSPDGTATGAPARATPVVSSANQLTTIIAARELKAKLNASKLRMKKTTRPFICLTISFPDSRNFLTRFSSRKVYPKPSRRAMRFTKKMSSPLRRVTLLNKAATVAGGLCHAGN